MVFDRLRTTGFVAWPASAHAAAASEEQLTSPEGPLAVQRYLHATDKNPAMFFLSAIQRLADPPLAKLVHTRILFPGNSPKLVVTLQPDSLLGALWLQFAAAVHANKSFAQCPQCRTIFEISRDSSGKRRSARFCSNRCRVAHYRERIERARELHARGIAPREIAPALGTTVATVSNWLRNR